MSDTSSTENKRKVGRPRKYANDAERFAAKRLNKPEYYKEYRRKHYLLTGK
jgi:AT hook motif